MKRKRINKKGIAQMVNYAVAFAVAAVALVIVLVLLQSIQTSNSTSMCATSTYVYNATTGGCNSPTNVSLTSGATYAANITTQGLVFGQNFANQWGLSGTILGYTLVLSILALIGVGGYMAYNKVRGSR